MSLVRLRLDKNLVAVPILRKKALSDYTGPIIAANHLKVLAFLSFCHRVSALWRLGRYSVQEQAFLWLHGELRGTRLELPKKPCVLIFSYSHNLSLLFFGTDFCFFAEDFVQ
jgi:hypothetical protein